MINKKFLKNAVLLFWSLGLAGSIQMTGHASDAVMSYIDNYKGIAVAEMERTGVPASIKLAQAILESNMGRSELASQANNHFGIKCGNNWNGKEYYLEDDDTDDSGNMVPSCFRVFSSEYESFVAHSEFLLASKRYAFLFDYDKKDYKSWAYGLRKAGYATDRQYPYKLISIIERYNLSRYDREEKMMATVTKKESTSEDSPNVKEDTRLAKSNSSLYPDKAMNAKYNQGTNNKVPFIIANGGETLSDIAAFTRVKVSELLEINEALGYENIVLDKGEVVYLKNKKGKYSGNEEFHLVQEGETMYTISQLYGLKLVNLYARNKMPRGSEPVPGAKIYLKATPSKEDRPAYHKHPRKDEGTILFGDDFLTSIK